MLPSHFQALVKAVEAASQADESHWIEWKGRLDLASAEDKAKVARCIVSLANRSPTVAAATCEGRGYMVVGAEPGAVHGLPIIDPADLESRLLPLLGSDGPRWQPHWVSVGGRDVLVIEVATPAPGDPVHTIRREMPGVGDGDVFIRRGAASHKANSAELAALVARATAAQGLRGLRVTLRETQLRPFNLSEEHVEQTLSRIREHYMRPLREHLEKAAQPGKPMEDTRLRRQPPSLSTAELMELEHRRERGEELTETEEEQLRAAHAAVRHALGSVRTSLGRFMQTQPEARTPDAYTTEVEEYLAQLRAALPEAVRTAASVKLAPAVFTVHNDTDENFPEVRVRVHLVGPVNAREPDEGADAKELLPSEPRLWGPRSINPFATAFPVIPDAGWLQGSAGYVPSTGPPVDIENSGSTTLRFSPVHLRPLDQDVPLSAVVLIAHLARGESLHGTWQATSTGARGVAQGTLAVTFRGEPWSLPDAFAEEPHRDRER
jgi:hypothetical protein